MRLILLAAMALAFSNSLCLGTCLVEESTATAKHDGCPQHQRPQHQSINCNPQKGAPVSAAEFPAPTAGDVVIVDLAISWYDGGFVPGNPPPESPPGVSVLRI